MYHKTDTETRSVVAGASHTLDIANRLAGDVPVVSVQGDLTDVLKAVALPEFADTVGSKLSAEFRWSDKERWHGNSEAFVVSRGSAYEMGDHHYFRNEYQHAVKWYDREASTAADPASRKLILALASAKLSRIYDLGFGVAISLPLQQEWRTQARQGAVLLREAVEVDGEAEAMFYLGRMLLLDGGMAGLSSEEREEAVRDGVHLVTLASQQG